MSSIHRYFFGELFKVFAASLAVFDTRLTAAARSIGLAVYPR